MAKSSTAESTRRLRRDGLFAGFLEASLGMVSAMLGPEDASSQPRTTTVKRPAHRPSRRKQIIAAATVVFAREGYVEANVEDIAKAAGVAPTAIYYHFGSKEDLFTEALRTAMDTFSEVAAHARPEGEVGPESLRTVLQAGFAYWQSHPNAARLVARYSEGSTAQALRLRREWEERHLTRAYDYLPQARSGRSNRRPRDLRSAHSLAIRVMLDVILVTQAAALDGTLGRVSRKSLMAAVEEMCMSLIDSID
jgi:AcrR family transcriptional regulator